MRLNVRVSLFTIAGLLCWTLSGAQTGFGKGNFSASLESNSIYYLQDSGLGESAPDDRFGSNNYLKMDYSVGKFSAGLQVEAYLPALYGYEIGMQPDAKKFFLASKYVRWTDDNFTVHVGDIYDQFGNGLVFRSYEDRNLGLNNSLEGIQATYSWDGCVSVKGMYGRPRLYTGYAGSWVRGASIDIPIADIFNWGSVLLTLEGNYVNRYESLGKETEYDFAALGIDNPNVNLLSGALDFNWNGLTLKGEYSVKSKDLASPSSVRAHRGAALFAEAVYGHKSFSASGTFRILDHMGTMLSLYGNGTCNSLNYLPALTRQYHYMLANLNPYQVNVIGEAAGQADLFYTLRSKESRRKYWVFHANYSTAYTIDGTQTSAGSGHNLLWSDINADVERHWNKSLKTLLLYSRQEWSPSHGYNEETYVSNIFVADVQYKFNSKYALRGELQYLLSNDYEGDWMAVLLEFTMAPHWNIYASEMYNNGVTGKHYYNAGVSWSRNKTRIQLSYGRNRAGYVCSGGVCRYSPAYTGLNLLISTSF